MTTESTRDELGLIELKDIIDNIIPSCGEKDCRTCPERHIRLAKELRTYQLIDEIESAMNRKASTDTLIEFREVTAEIRKEAKELDTAHTALNELKENV